MIGTNDTIEIRLPYDHICRGVLTPKGTWHRVPRHIVEELRASGVPVEERPAAARTAIEVRRSTAPVVTK